MKDDQRIVLTKRMLQEGLLRLLKSKDISKINVTELCNESGINRATFYRHYEQPRDILADIRRNMSLEVKKLADKNRTHLNVLPWLEDICNYFYENRDMLSILFKCRTDEEFVDLINELYQKQYSLIKHSDITNTHDDTSLKLATYYVSGGIIYMLRQWILEPINKSPKEMAQIIYQLTSK